MRKQAQDEIGLSRVKRELLSRLLKEEGIDGETPGGSFAIIRQIKMRFIICARENLVF